MWLWRYRPICNGLNQCGGITLRGLLDKMYSEDGTLRTGWKYLLELCSDGKKQTSEAYERGFLSNSSRYTKKKNIFEGSQSSSAGPPNRSSVMIKLTVQYWWRANNRGRKRYQERTPLTVKELFFQLPDIREKSTVHCKDQPVLAISGNYRYLLLMFYEAHKYNVYGKCRDLES